MDFTVLMKIRTMWNEFCSRHPKFPSFIEAVSNKGVVEGCTIEVTFDYLDGSHIKGGIVVSEEDLALLNEIMSLSKEMKQ